MREKIAIKSSAIGISANLIGSLLSVITSRFFVLYIGIEVMGINGVFSNIIGFLQLTELGIGTAITYALYQPIVDENTREIQILMNFFKNIYRWIFVAILIIGTFFIPFLRFFVTETSYDYSYIVLIFCIQLAATASTYLLAYKRNLLYADQKQYIAVFIDAIVNTCCTLIRIFIIIYTKSYVTYLIFQVLQQLISNLIVNAKCNKIYPFLKEKVVEKYDKMDKLLFNLKNIVIGRLGGWVYSSTDNVIMSRFVGIKTVGMMVNYYTLIGILKAMVSAIVSPIQPMIANYIRDEKTTKESYDLFLTYTFIRYCIANVASVGMAVMCNRVITVWIGEEYTLPNMIPFLLATDLFIGVTHGPTGEFIAALGLFHNDKEMSIVAMIINLGLSLLLVGKFGVCGVLIGTVIAQVYYWIARTKIVFSNYFVEGLTIYIKKTVKYIVTVIIETYILLYILSYIQMNTYPFIELILQCAICIFVASISIWVTNFRTNEYKSTKEMVKNVLLKKEARINENNRNRR